MSEVALPLSSDVSRAGGAEEQRLHPAAETVNDENFSDDDDMPWGQRMGLGLETQSKVLEKPDVKDVKKEEPADDQQVGQHHETPKADKKSKAVKIEEDDDDDSLDDIPWALRMEIEEKEKHGSSKRNGKKEDSDDEYTPKAKKEGKKKEATSHKSSAKRVKEEEDDDDSLDDIPWAQRMQIEKKEKSGSSSKRRSVKREDSDDEDRPPAKKERREKTTDKKSNGSSEIPKKRVKKEEEVEEVWEWWKEEKKPAGVKWNSLSHKGPLFAPPYERLPKNVHFKYNGEVMRLSEEAEEVAGFYGRMLDHEFTSKADFNKNFFHDWRKSMTPAERDIITDLNKCDFRQIDIYYKEQSEKRKAMSKEEKLKIKEENEAKTRLYGVAIIDGHKQKIGNFRIEPPGLFRGRGEHPKMGRLKKRIRPEDVIINCSKNSEIPAPPAGHKWKEVRHDNTVTWLVSWTENVLGNIKYIMLNPSSKIKGEKDYEKYETARRLKKEVAGIRNRYTADFKNHEMRVRQMAVALYFIDKLALRAGNEKDTDEAADTVGCCSLRYEHIKLIDSKDGPENVVVFDFPGKDSIRYFNEVAVDHRVFKNLKLFMENKNKGDDLFDRLDTTALNQHLQSLAPGLTVKVFRTFNASITLQDQLAKLTNPKDTVAQKMLSYNRANKDVAVLCNHQRAVSKTHGKSMETLDQKIKEKKKELKAAKEELKEARGANKEKAQKKVDRLKEQYKKLKFSYTEKDENKNVSLGTSKLNYLDPRISVAWCKKFDVPIERVFNKTLREKFRWAIDMADEDYVF